MNWESTVARYVRLRFSVPMLLKQPIYAEFACGLLFQVSTDGGPPRELKAS